MKNQRLKATIKSALLLGRDDANNPKAFDIFYRVSNWPETPEDVQAVFGAEFVERFARYEDAHNTKGSARRDAQAYVDAAESAARAIAPGMDATECADALLSDAEAYSKITGDRRKASDAEIEELTAWVEAQLETEQSYSFGPTFTISAALAKKGSEMAALVPTLKPDQREALRAGMVKRDYQGWTLADGYNPTAEDCAAWLAYRARFDAAQVKADPLAALA